MDYNGLMMFGRMTPVPTAGLSLIASDSSRRLGRDMRLLSLTTLCMFLVAGQMKASTLVI